MDVDARIRWLVGALVLLALPGCGDDGDDGPTDGTDAAEDSGGDSHPDTPADTPADVPADGDADVPADSADDAPPDAPAGTLSERYPGDLGLGGDPAVIWFEDFEEGSLAAVAGRYDQVRDDGNWTLVADTPSGTGSALALRAGVGHEAVDLYKQLPDGDEWYVRWYARYEPGIQWHHSGMWFGGYNPGSPWPSPGAGTRPNGDDRFSIAVEPVWDSPSLRFDFYNYWMRMHSWMAVPVDDGTAYYGNSLVHRNDFTVDEPSWVCLEAHALVNPDPAGGTGGVLEVWKNDVPMVAYSDAGPLGYWIRDKFCTPAADGAECTDYPAPASELLDLQVRNTSALRLNAFWPQNYITEGPDGTLTFDQLVVATVRVGCMH
jgi:hypothetical protein